MFKFKKSLPRVLNILISLVLIGNTILSPFAASSPLTQEPATSAVQTPRMESGSAVVSIEDFAFVPEVITITIGTELTWTNNGSVIHEVKSGTPPEPTPFPTVTPVDTFTPTPTGTLTVTLTSTPSGTPPTPTPTPTKGPPSEKKVYLPIILNGAETDTAPDQNTGGNSNYPDGTHLKPGTVLASPTQNNWDSGPLNPGESFSFTFEAGGTYDYFDPLYPEMTGQIVVVPNMAPVVTILTPEEGAVVGANVQVTGMVADDGVVVSVLVNAIPAALNGNSFDAAITLENGNQVIDVVALDNDGSSGFASRLVGVDADGPMLAIHAPEDRQAVYTLNPTVAISYTDFYTGVNTTSLNVTLNDQNGVLINVTGDLNITGEGASGTISTALSEDTTYTMTASMEDALGNASLANISFYVPLDPGIIIPPVEPPVPGWVSGVVYDSTTCNEHLTNCQGWAGVKVNLAWVDTEALAAIRAARQQQLVATNYEKPLAPIGVTTSTIPVTGTVITGPDGFFAFPVDQTGTYWLRAEKDGYTYSQREMNIVLEHSTATNDIYLTPLDPAITPCDESGCSHTNSDGTIQLDIPAGAIPPGQTVDVNATNFTQVEFLPSGALPPGTWETYAYNLGGASEITFTQPIAVQVMNTLGFAPGTPVPLGYWNQATQAWEHAGTGLVDPTGQWVVMQVMHFSNYDCNDPLAPLANTTPIVEDQAGDDQTPKPGACEEGCVIDLQTGNLGEQIDLPTVNVLGEPTAPTLLYNTNRANPTEVIDLKLSLNIDPSVELGDYVGFELYIEGIKTDSFTFSTTFQTGEVGRYRYLWDGRDAQGNLLPPGIYAYSVKLSIPYRAQYCYALGGIFGNPPDCEFGATGIFVDAVEDVWVNDTVELNTQIDSPFGVGWVLRDWQQLFEDEAGRILIVEGDEVVEYYAAGKDLLIQNGEANTPAWNLPLNFPPYNPPSGDGQAEEGTTPNETEAPPHIETPPAPVPSSEEGDTPTIIETPPTLVPALEETEPPDEPLTPLTSSPAPNENQEPVHPLPPSTSITPPEPTEIIFASDLDFPATDVGGTISTDTIWNVDGSPYIVTSNIIVPANVTLTIEPGVEVRLNQGLYFQTNGTLLAIGTPAQSITFTATVEDAIGYWGSLSISGSNSNGSHLGYVTFEGGGANGNPTLQIATSLPTLDHLTIRNSGGEGLLVVNEQLYGLTLDTALIENNVQEGVTLWDGNGIVLENLTIQNNGGYGIYVGNSYVTDFTLRNSLIQGNAVAGRLVVNTTLDNNAWPENTRNEVEWWGGTLTASRTWPLQEAIYRVLGSVTVPANVTLTIEPGVEVQMNQGVSFQTNGTLLAVGTPTEPITITATLTDAVGYWGFLSIWGSEGSHLSYVTVEGGGSNGNPTLLIASSVPTLDHLTIRNSGGEGLQISNSSTPGLVLDTALIENNTQEGIHIWEGIGITLENLTVQNNGGYGIYVANNYAGITDFTLRNNVIQGNAVAGRLVVNTTLENNIWTGNIRNEIEWMEGALTASRTWPLQEAIYRVLGSVTVPANVTLTIEPGVEVRLNQGISFSAQGTLLAVGTPTQPITFTAAIANAIGYWGSLSISGSNSNGSHLSYVTLEGGGSSFGNSTLFIGQSTPTLDHLTIRNSGGEGLQISNPSTPGLVLDTALIENNTQEGIHIWEGIDITLENLTVQNNGGYGIYVANNYPSVTDFTLRNNVFQGNAVAGRLVVNTTLENNIWTGNIRNEIEWMAGTLTASRTWPLQEAIYRVLGSVTVSANVTLTIEPGVEVRLNQGGYFQTNGTLLAVGTPTQPITFTAAVANAIGYWGSLSLSESDSSHLSYVTIEGGGANGGDALLISQSTPTLDHLTIRNSGGMGFYVHNSSTPGLVLDTALIENNVQDGVHIWEGIDITLQNLTVQNNGGYGINAANSYVSLVTVRNCLIGGNAVAARLPVNSNLENNNWAGNTRNEIEWWGGTLTASRTWPFDVAAYRVMGDITVADGITLTIEAGVNVIFSQIQELAVNGNLVAVGNVNNPIRFTPVQNGVVGYWDQIRIGGGSIPTDSDLSILKFVTIEGAGFSQAALNISQSTPTLDHITIRDSGDDALYVYNSNGLEISISNFINIAGYGIRNATPAQVINATYNYWGDSTGPYHPTQNPGGLGAQVSDGVLFEPWLLEETLEIGILSQTATDYTQLIYDSASNTYTRLYLDGTQVHFNPDGTHDYTLAPDGRKTAYTYHPDGTIATLDIYAPGETTPRWVWIFTYESGQLTGITDPVGRVTTFTVDAQNNLTSVTTPDSATQGFAYDPNHLLTHATDQNGAISTHVYDAYGRIATVIEPPRAVYNPLTGNTVITQEVQTFYPSDTAYPLINSSLVGDPNNPAPPVPLSDALIDRVVYGVGERSGHTNKWGHWLDQTDGVGRTTLTQYDEANNLTRTDAPDSDCIEYTYDDNGHVLTETRLEAAQCALVQTQRDPSSAQTWTYTYEDQFNQVKTETDPNSNTTTYVYDYEEGVGSAGKLIRVEYPQVQDENGQWVMPMEHYTYNDLGLLETNTDARGTVTHYEYTPDGWLMQIIEDDGGLNLTTTYQDFDLAGNAQTVIFPTCCGLQRVVYYTYDEMNRVLTETDALGNSTTYTYDGRGNIVQRVVTYTDAGGQFRNAATLSTYNAHDQLLSEYTIADGPLVGTWNNYDINRNLVTQADGNGHTTTYLYDDANQLASETDPTGYPKIYTYYPDGLLDTITGGRENMLKYLYDGVGRLVTEIRDLGGLDLATNYTYDENGNLHTVTDPVGTITRYEYDALNRRILEVRDDGSFALATSFAYDLNGNLAKVTDERGVVTRMGYDPLNRISQTTLDVNGLGLVMTYQYNSAGNLDRLTDERGIVTYYEYDALNRLVLLRQDENGLALDTTYTYDGLGNQITNTDPNGVTTCTIYNFFGVPVRVLENYGELNVATDYLYDNALNLIQITDANGNVTVYEYEARDLLVTTTYADTTTVVNTYDENGNLSTRLDQSGNLVTYTYDGTDRLISRAFPTGTQTFDYDDASRLTVAEDTLNGHTVQVEYGYNDLNDVTGETQTLDGDAYPISYAYDYQAGTTTTTYPSGVQVTHTVDSLRRLAQVTQNSALVTEYAYDDLNGLFTLTHANGTETQTEMDPLHRITRVWTHTGSNTLADYHYGYDDAGNRTYMQRTHKTGTPTDVYAYDPLYQLAQVWYGANATDPAQITAYDSQQTYTLDSLRNRLALDTDGNIQVYLPNDGQQLTNSMNRYEQVDTTPFGYDLRGNLLNDGSNTYTYDLENRQTGMDNAGHTAEYLYDAFGRRVAKIVDGQLTRYVYNVDYQIVEERDATGTLAARYTYGATIDEPLTMWRGGQTYTYHRDALGSVTEITDNAGALVERYEYNVYGVVTIYDYAWNPLPISTLGNPFLFTGRQFDPESGNYYYRARMYHPVIGRFLQMDPLGYVDGMNLYQYTRNSPVTNRDPSGYFTVDDVFMLTIPTGSYFKTYKNLTHEAVNIYNKANNLYGNCCGADKDCSTNKRNCNKKTSLSPGANDGIDWACYTHDECLSNAGTWWIYWIPQVRECHRNLCRMAKAFSGGTIRQRSAKRDLILVFCTLSVMPPPEKLLYIYFPYSWLR